MFNTVSANVQGHNFKTGKLRESIQDLFTNMISQMCYEHRKLIFNNPQSQIFTLKMWNLSHIFLVFPCIYYLTDSNANRLHLLQKAGHQIGRMTDWCGIGIQHSIPNHFNDYCLEVHYNDTFTPSQPLSLMTVANQVCLISNVSPTPSVPTTGKSGLGQDHGFAECVKDNIFLHSQWTLLISMLPTHGNLAAANNH